MRNVKTNGSRTKPVWLTLSALLLALSVAVATAGPAGIFGDHMVLQRDKPVPVWGTAAPKAPVTVSFAGQEKKTRADGTGKWRVDLDPMPASDKGRTLTVVLPSSPRPAPDPLGDLEEEKEVVRFKDVLVGEVWLCSGQSNMQWVLKNLADATKEIQAADVPLIRHYREEWAVCTPETAPNFSAVAYFFGRLLHKHLQVPVGLLHRSQGATAIEHWMLKDVLLKVPYGAKMSRICLEEKLGEYRAYNSQRREHGRKMEERKRMRDEGKDPGPEPVLARLPEYWTACYVYTNPGAMYRKHILPVIPYAIRGVTWYQGESNALIPGGCHAYRDLLPAMIKSWRDAWRQGDPSTGSGQAFPFYYVQLPKFRQVNYPLIRESMLKCLKVKNTGMAVCIDLGKNDSVHPGDKSPVGRRLALLALEKTYGKKLEGDSPLFQSMKITGDKAEISFAHAEGLHAKGGQVTGFEIAGKDRVFCAAQARIERDRVVVWSQAVRQPVAVRYAFAPSPAASLYNGADLPASPFRSDDWPLDYPTQIWPLGY